MALLANGDEVGDPVIEDHTDPDNPAYEFNDVFTATLTNVRAFADGTDRFAQQKLRFRDIDYLSYLNNQEEGYVSTFASTDNVNWVRVVPVKKDAIANFEHSIWGSSPYSSEPIGSAESLFYLDDPTVLDSETDFNKWESLQVGMRLVMPLDDGTTHETTAAAWSQIDKTITMSDPVPVGKSVSANAAVRFGDAEVMLDEDTQQFSFRKVRYDGLDGKYSGVLFQPFNETDDQTNGLLTGESANDVVLADVKHFRLFFDPWFESNEIDTECRAYATMTTDPAQGRAAISQGEVVLVEVTYPGSGYTRTPQVFFSGSGSGASARSVVEGGIFEIKLLEAGFNYQGVARPGLNSTFVRDRPLPVFDATAMPFGARMPKADFIARNTSIRGGEVIDPGAGLRLAGETANSTSMNGFINGDLRIIPDSENLITPAVFQAVVEPDGKILRFEKLGGGDNYRIAPMASVEAPLAPSNGTAISFIDSSLQEVTSIGVVEAGHRYANAPKVFIQPPQPRGEGRPAKAVAVLGPSGEVSRIIVTDRGAGYTKPPRVEIQAVDSYNVVENVDIAANVSAAKYEFYVSRSSWTERERGSILVRPTNVLGNSGGASDWIFIEAAATDMTFEGDVNASKVTVLMNSREEDQPFAPYSMTTLSTATGEQSGTVIADQLVITMGNNVPTPLSGGTLQNKVFLQTDVASLRATAAESVRNPRGAFPYDIHIDELNDITVEAVPRSSGSISLNVPEGDIRIIAGIFTDGDIRIETKEFTQTTPLVTEFGSISIKAEKIDALNSVIVNAAAIDEQDSDINLHATDGSINLQGTIQSPNAIYLRQQNINGQVGGNTRLRTKALRVEAEGNVNVFSAVEEARGSSDFGDFTLNELDDISISTIQVPEGKISLTANGVDLGGGAVNPIALSAQIVEGAELFVSTPNGSMEINVDTSADVNLGLLDNLIDPAIETLPMLAAGSVKIINASGDIIVYDGPVAGQNATVVKAASTDSLPNVHAYAGNTPREFPSELSGPGAFPSDKFSGVEEIRVGDRLLLKDQIDRVATDRFDESRENGVYEVMRLGGGDSGFRDWLLRRAVDGDAREDLPPGSYVRIREGQHAGDIFQLSYSILPSFGVVRTQNSQLVIDSGIGGLLDLDINDVVTGDGILSGARVTGIDYGNGVVTLGAGNGYQLSNPVFTTVGPGTEAEETLGIVSVAAGDSLLFESLQGAIDRAEKVLISGEWFSVGAVVEDFDSSAGTITISEGGLRDGVTGESNGIIGFTTAASGRVSLNPAVRSFLLNNVRKETVLNSASLVKREVVIREFDVVNPTMGTEGASSGPGTFDTMDVRLSELDGWEVRRGDEMIYTTRINMGDSSAPVYRDVHQVNRIIDVIRGDSTPQDSVDNPYVRVQLAEPVDESFLDRTNEQRLISTRFAFRNKTHVVPDVSIDWDSLYVGTGLRGDGILDGTYLLGWDKQENVLILNQEVETVDYRVEFDPGEIYVNGTKGESYGENYSTDTNFRVGVEFSAPDTAQSNGGVQMEGYAVPDGTGGVEKVIITQQGRGYTTPPTITIEKGVNDSGGTTRAKGSVLFDPQYWWADSSGSDPSNSPTFALQHRLGGDDSSILMSANFTNYDGLAPGQPVFGDGVSSGTVITRVFPAIQRVEVTPGGLPTRLSVTDSGITLSSIPSDYYTDGFDHVLQMPNTFNEFHTLRVGQRVTFPQNSNVPETVITALDTTYRQIGLRAVPAGLDGEAVSEVIFESLDRVEFGMITRTGSGNASFSVTPFGYEAMAVTTPMLASGIARLDRYENDSGRYELELKEFDKPEGVRVDRYVSGSGIKHGYRVASFDGRNVRLKSAGLTLVENSTDTFLVDSLFTAFSRLEVGMPVYGGTVPGGTKIAPNGIDPANRTVTLEGGAVGINLSAISGDVVFGDPFTDNFVSRDTALTSFSVHREEAEISSLISASNIRDTVRYAVSTEGGANKVAGSLARHMLITQRNEYHTAIDSFGYETQPTVTFLPNVNSIELTEPLPAIVASDIAIDGRRQSDGQVVEVVGRFITTTLSGANVLSDSIVNGFSVQGAEANGTTLRNLKFGGLATALPCGLTAPLK